MSECTHTFSESQVALEGGKEDGCWYCGGFDDPLLFSIEWDAPVHLCCVAKVREIDPEDIEAKVFAKEFGIE